MKNLHLLLTLAILLLAGAAVYKLYAPCGCEGSEEDNGQPEFIVVPQPPANPESPYPPGTPRNPGADIELPPPPSEDGVRRIVKMY